MQSSDRLRFVIDERLHAQTNAVHAALQQGVDERGRKRSRSAFDRTLGIGCDRKLSAHGGENAQQLRGIEDGRSSSAQVNGIGDVIKSSSERVSHLRCELARVGNIFEQAGNVIFVSRFREHVGREVAVAALGPAEGDGNVEAERHTLVILYSMGRGRARTEPRTVAAVAAGS